MKYGTVRHRSVRTGLLVALVLATSAVWSGPASATPVSGPHETIDSSFTTNQPDAVSGFIFSGSYHAVGDAGANPPYMRRMISYSPPGLRFDTSVPQRCTASDIVLEVRGAAACPAGSRLGGGTTTTSFLGRYPSTIALDFFNNADEQIILARSPLLSTVARGHIHPDGSIEFASPTCFPSLGPAGCPIDNVLQLQSSLTVSPYTRSAGGVVRSYMTTPPTCPAAGHWETPIRLWWADGSVDTVVTAQSCTAP
ncbi:MAG: hypothetical protein QOI98_2715 [Solirubrobacteraceae bacterium]|jgi:hypothetical protein|nr:hypothetical protein [Solirubrobacteraceae bacterium]